MIIIAITSPVGGSGKSSVALSLASLLSNLQLPVTLIETDPANLLAYQMGQTEYANKGLCQGLKGLENWPDLVYGAELGFRFMPFGQQSHNESIELALKFAQKKTALSTAINGCMSTEEDIFIFDTAKLPNFLAHAVLQVSDLNLITLTPDSNSLLSIDPTIKSLLESRGSNYFLMNRFKANQVLHLDIWALARIKLGHRLLPFYLVEDQAMPEAFASGLNLEEYSPSSQLAENLHKLANWIHQELHAHV